MVDPPARRRLRQALAQLVDGQIATCEFTDVFDGIRNSPDRGMVEIGLIGSARLPQLADYMIAYFFNTALRKPNIS